MKNSPELRQMLRTHFGDQASTMTPQEARVILTEVNGTALVPWSPNVYLALQELAALDHGERYRPKAQERKRGKQLSRKRRG